jgi:hypothetical protein
LPWRQGSQTLKAADLRVVGCVPSALQRASALELRGSDAAFLNFAPAAGVHHGGIAIVTTAVCRPPMSSIIPDRAEFVDALRSLRKGHVLIRVHDASGGCLLDGAAVYRSFQTLLDYGLIREFQNRDGFPNVRYYRITASGREFAERACQSWQTRPLLERLAVRLAG